MFNSQRTGVFVSYSHLDRDWIERLRPYLEPGIRNGRLDYFDDSQITPGAEWRLEIFAAIDRARIAILLVSPSFLASQFIMEEELPRIMAAQSSGLTVLWVPLSGKFDELLLGQAFSERQSVCDPRQPLDKMDESLLTFVWQRVSRQINQLLKSERLKCNLPFHSLGELFKGRRMELDALSRRISSTGAAAVLKPQVIHGMAGMGKTRLALEFAWQHVKQFSAVLFVNAETSEDFTNSLAALCASDLLDLDEQLLDKAEDKKAAVIRWLQQNRDWLMIIDNVDTTEAVEAVRKVLPLLHGGQIIITSQITEWGAGMDCLALREIPIEEACALLLQRASQASIPVSAADHAAAAELASELGCLPLALNHAAAYIQHYGTSLPGYLDEFRRNFASVIQYHDDRLIEYAVNPAARAQAKTVSTTFFMAYDRLGALEQLLLRACSHLAPAPIPSDLFDFAKDGTKALLKLGGQPCADAQQVALRESLAVLARSSLIMRGEGTFAMHRLEQLVMRQRFAPENESDMVEAVQAVILEAAPPGAVDSPGTWTGWSLLKPHAETLLQHPAARASAARLALLIALRDLHYAQGNFIESLRLGHESAAVAESLQGRQSQSSATALTSLSLSYRELGLFTDAEDHAREALGIFEDIGQQETPEAASALIALGESLYVQGRKLEREPYYQRALVIRRRHFPNGSKALAESLNNMASAVQDRGDLVQAEQLYRECIHVAAKTVSLHDPELCNWHNNLGDFYQETGKTRQAEASYRSSIQVIEQGPMPDHPKLSVPLINLASLYLQRRWWRWREIERLADRALEISGKYFRQDQTPYRNVATNHALLILSVRFLQMLALCVAFLLVLAFIPNIGWLVRAVAPLGLFVFLAWWNVRRNQALIPALQYSRQQNQSDSLTFFHGMSVERINWEALRFQNLGQAGVAEMLFRHGLARKAAHPGELDLLRENYASFLHQFRHDLPGSEAGYQALQEDLAARGQEPDSILLVKMSALFFSQGRLDEALARLQHGWELHMRRDDGFAPRFPFLRALIALSRNEDASLWLGQLKTMKESHWSVSNWFIPGLVDDFRSSASAEDLQLVELLVDYLGHRQRSPRDWAACEKWVAVIPRPIEESWPG